MSSYEHFRKFKQNDKLLRLQLIQTLQEKFKDVLTKDELIDPEEVLYSSSSDENSISINDSKIGKNAKAQDAEHSQGSHHSDKEELDVESLEPSLVSENNNQQVRIKNASSTGASSQIQISDN